MRHVTVEEMSEAMSSVGPYGGYIWRIETRASQSEQSGESWVYEQSDKSESEAVVRQSHLVEAWEAEEPTLF